MTAAATLDQLGVAHPEWRAWLGAFAAARRACAEDHWRSLLPRVPPGLSPETPRLAGASVGVDARRVRQLIQNLVSAARDSGESTAKLPSATIDGDTACDLLAASLNDDDDRCAEIARRTGADTAALAALAALATMPLLHAYREAWRASIPATWSRDYCPVCGAWPTLVEACGLERARLLRCGRCGSGWTAECLRCPYCGERDHHALGSLVPETNGDTRKIETCLTCRGYVKVVVTLRPAAGVDVRLRDVETIDLDLVALERGFTRPARPGYRLGVSVTPRARAGVLGALLPPRR